MSLNDQIRKNSYEATLSRESSVKATAKHKMGVKKLDYAKTPEIRNQRSERISRTLSAMAAPRRA